MFDLLKPTLESAGFKNINVDVDGFSVKGNYLKEYKIINKPSSSKTGKTTSALEKFHSDFKGYVSSINEAFSSRNTENNLMESIRKIRNGILPEVKLQELADTVDSNKKKLSEVEENGKQICVDLDNSKSEINKLKLTLFSIEKKIQSCEKEMGFYEEEVMKINNVNAKLREEIQSAKGELKKDLSLDSARDMKMQAKKEHELIDLIKEKNDVGWFMFSKKSRLNKRIGELSGKIKEKHGICSSFSENIKKRQECKWWQLWKTPQKISLFIERRAMLGQKNLEVLNKRLGDVINTSNEMNVYISKLELIKGKENTIKNNEGKINKYNGNVELNNGEIENQTKILEETKGKIYLLKTSEIDIQRRMSINEQKKADINGKILSAQKSINESSENQVKLGDDPEHAEKAVNEHSECMRNKFKVIRSNLKDTLLTLKKKEHFGLKSNIESAYEFFLQEKFINNCPKSKGNSDWLLHK
jgi:chromosome segregation ATPase